MNFFTYVGMYTCAAFVLLALIIVGLSLIDRPARKREAARLREMVEATTPTKLTWTDTSKGTDYEVTNIEIVTPRHFPALEKQDWRNQ